MSKYTTETHELISHLCAGIEEMGWGTSEIPLSYLDRIERAAADLIQLVRKHRTERTTPSAG